MPMQNADVDVADILKKTADLLDIEGANPFRVRAYRNAARTVEGLSGEASDVADLTELAGIGKDLAWIPPELREDGGEIEAAEQDALPDLVRIEDIRAYASS